MKKATIFLGIALILLACILFVFIFSTEGKLARLKTKTFVEMVPDFVLEKVAKKVLDEVELASVLQRRDFTGWSFTHHEVFYNLRQIVFGHSMFKYEPGGDENLYEAQRTILMAAANLFLKSPENVKAFYEQKKEIFLQEYWKRDAIVQGAFQEWLNVATQGLEVYKDGCVEIEFPEEGRVEKWDVRKAREEYLEAYTLAHVKWQEGLPLRIEWERGEKDEDLALLEKMNSEENELNRKRDGKWSDLNSLTPDLEATLFAGRQVTKGGEELLVAWIWVAKELQSSLDK